MRNGRPALPHDVYLGAGLSVPRALKAAAFDGAQNRAHGVVNGAWTRELELTEFCEGVRFHNSILANSIEPLKTLLNGNLTFGCKCHDCRDAAHGFNSRVVENEFIALNIFHQRMETPNAQRQYTKSDMLDRLNKDIILPNHAGITALVAAVAHPQMAPLLETLCEETAGDVERAALRGVECISGTLLSAQPCITQQGVVKQSPFQFVGAAEVKMKLEWIVSKRALSLFIDKLERLNNVQRSIVYSKNSRMELKIVSSKKIPANALFTIALRLKRFKARSMFQLKQEIDGFCDVKDLLDFPVNPDDDVDIKNI